MAAPAPTLPARRPLSPWSYRYPSEQIILFATLTLIVVIMAATTLAVHLVVVLVAGVMALAYLGTRSRHGQLMAQAAHITAQTAPGLWALVQMGVARLEPGPVEVYVAPSQALNAYTFGMDAPKVVVLEAPLLQALDADEVGFVIGHELGHVRLGHTWLNSLIGGLAGIPSPQLTSGALRLVFLSWNRACEFSADRAGLLATGKPEKAISALVKIASGGRAHSAADVQRALQLVEAEGDDLVQQLGEVLATHPLMARRIAELRKYAASDAYLRLAGGQ